MPSLSQILRLRRAPLWLALALTSLALGCERCDDPERYRSRGLVRGIEGAEPDVTLTVHHEAISNFKNHEGKLTPMPAMTMMFGVSETLLPLQLAAGDKIELEFDVRWERRPALMITHIALLDDDTELKLSGGH